MKKNDNDSPMSANDFDSIILLGDSMAGKTSIIARFSQNIFSNSVHSTAGVTNVEKTININGKEHLFRLWDTAGQERFRSLGKSYYRYANGIMLIYDISNRRSFENISEWIKQIREETNEIPILLIGNKIDLENERVTAREEGKEMAQNLDIKFKEVSAKEGTNIEEAFVSLATEIIKAKGGNRGDKDPNISIDNNKDNKENKGCC